MNKPIRTVSVFCLVLFLALMVNATYLQFWQADSLADHPLNRRVVEEAYSRERGAILVGRTPVAESEPVDDEFEFLRTYPSPLLYAPLTGYFSFEFGATGVERSQTEVLSGDDPRLFVPRLIDLVSSGSQSGGNVELTIDPAAQQAAFDGLRALGSDVQGAVVALEPASGRVLAMVSLPSYDPNELASHDFGSVRERIAELQAAPSSPLTNRAIATRIFPGSVFKVVTAAAALEEGLYDSADAQVPGGDTYQLPQSTNVLGNEGRACGATTVSFSQAMANSCNTTFAALADQVGADAMLAQAEDFGFNADYLEDLPGQARSSYPLEANAPNTALSGIGQFEVQATPLQMAMVAAGIANDGVVMRPYVVDEVQSADFDAQATSPQELSRAVSADSAAVLTQLMADTVDQGTAAPAAIPGVSVGAKTGTAQSGTDASPFAWFISLAPADDPEVAVAVMIQNADIPRSEIAGGRLGGPIARAVMEAVIQ